MPPLISVAFPLSLPAGRCAKCRSNHEVIQGGDPAANPAGTSDGARPPRFGAPSHPERRPEVSSIR